MTHELTEAERAFDSFIQTRREQGRATYGQGLDHRDARWSWERMALEELADACQYLVAETLRLRDDLAQERAERDEARAEVEQLRGNCLELVLCLREAREARGGRGEARIPRTPEGGC